MMLTEKIFNILKERNIDYKYIEHAPTVTCEESAAARGEDIGIGGKTLLFKDKRDFRIFVISARLQADSNRIRKILRSQRLRFATAQELMDLAGVEKGALPPFGREFLPYDLYVDYSVLYNDKIAFNAGDITKSVIMSTNDWLSLVEPKFCSFSKL